MYSSAVYPKKQQEKSEQIYSTQPICPLFKTNLVHPQSKEKQHPPQPKSTERKSKDSKSNDKSLEKKACPKEQPRPAPVSETTSLFSGNRSSANELGSRNLFTNNSSVNLFGSNKSLFQHQKTTTSQGRNFFQPLDLTSPQGDSIIKSNLFNNNQKAQGPSVNLQQYNNLQVQNASLIRQNQRLNQQLKNVRIEFNVRRDHILKLQAIVQSLTQAKQKLEEEKRNHKCKLVDKKTVKACYNFNQFMDSSKEEKIEKSRENGTKYSEQDNKMAASLIKNCEEMEMQLSKLRKNEVILKKKVEMWKRKYMEIEEQKMELEMELSGEWCDLEDESYDDILSVSSMGAFRKEKGDKIHKNSKK